MSGKTDNRKSDKGKNLSKIDNRDQSKLFIETAREKRGRREIDG
jgi:hypothetical protein